ELAFELIFTPLEQCDGHRLRQGIVLVPVLRAGLAFLDAFPSVFPDARVGFLGIRRDEEHDCVPLRYYGKLPQDLQRCSIFLLDPMCATGGSACDAIAEIKA